MPKHTKNQASKNSRSQPRNQFRIIGGKWRGRKFEFPGNPAIRPSPDRVRETLFNWLIGHIAEARVLDCFAGSGALGLEALSRGAAHATFVELDAVSINAIQQHLITLSAENEAESIHGDALDYLSSTADFDVVFLDPPFNRDLLPPCLEKLAHSLVPGALVYVESEPSWLNTNTQFTCLKSKQAGEVKYQLLEKLA